MYLEISNRCSPVNPVGARRLSLYPAFMAGQPPPQPPVTRGDVARGAGWRACRGWGALIEALAQPLSPCCSGSRPTASMWCCGGRSASPPNFIHLSMPVALQRIVPREDEAGSAWRGQARADHRAGPHRPARVRGDAQRCRDRHAFPRRAARRRPAAGGGRAVRLGTAALDLHRGGDRPRPAARSGPRFACAFSGSRSHGSASRSASTSRARAASG